MGLIKMNGVNYWGSAYGQGIIAPMIYSEEEIEVGVWTDGKPLYQKTIIYETLNNNSYQNIVEITTEEVKEINAVFVRSDGKEVIRGDWVSSLFYLVAVAVASDTKIYLMSKRNTSDSNWTTAKLICTLQYTKTTDTAGSGTYTPSKALAVHYSTNEHVVGTWINNKPLYEQTIHMSANFSSTKTYSIPTAEDLFLVDGFFVCASGSTQYQVPLNYPESGYSSYSGWNKTAHNVFFRLAGFSSTDVYATVRYTKTTD